MKNQKSIRYDPTPVQYNGIKFRSTLEARWALFFDFMGFSYEYEPTIKVEGLGTVYTPDFYLKKFNVYVEVKPENIDILRIEMFKAASFGTYIPIIFAVGPPSSRSIIPSGDAFMTRVMDKEYLIFGTSDEFCFNIDKSLQMAGNPKTRLGFMKDRRPVEDKEGIIYEPIWIGNENTYVYCPMDKKVCWDRDPLIFNGINRIYEFCSSFKFEKLT